MSTTGSGATAGRVAYELVLSSYVVKSVNSADFEVNVSCRISVLLSFNSFNVHGEQPPVACPWPYPGPMPGPRSLTEPSGRAGRGVTVGRTGVGMGLGGGVVVGVALGLAAGLTLGIIVGACSITASDGDAVPLLGGTCSVADTGSGVLFTTRTTTAPARPPATKTTKATTHAGNKKVVRDRPGNKVSCLNEKALADRDILRRRSCHVGTYPVGLGFGSTRCTARTPTGIPSPRVGDVSVTGDSGIASGFREPDALAGLNASARRL